MSGWVETMAQLDCLFTALKSCLTRSKRATELAQSTRFTYGPVVTEGDKVRAKVRVGHNATGTEGLGSVGTGLVRERAERLEGGES